MSSGRPRNKLYRELFNESLDLIILASLDKRTMCGSELTDYITEKVDSINSSILYKRLKNLEANGLITSPENGYAFDRSRKVDRRKILYELTEKGQMGLCKAKEEFDSFAEDMNQLFNYV